MPSRNSCEQSSATYQFVSMSTKRKRQDGATAALSWKKRQEEAEKAAKKDCLGDVIKEWTKRKSTCPNGQLPRGALNEIFAMFGSPEWLTKNALFNEIKRRENQVHHNPPVSTVDVRLSGCDGSTTSSMSMLTMEEWTNQSTSGPTINNNQGSVRTNKGGRPKGTKNDSAEQLKRCISDAVTEATMMYNEEVKESKQKGVKMPDGKLKEIIKKAGRSNGLTSPETIEYIKPGTVRSRLSRGNLFGMQISNQSPMRHVEGVLVRFCVMLNRMAVTIDSGTFIELANDIIRGTNVEEQMKQWKGKRKVGTDTLGHGYYARFMERHKHIISSVTANFCVACLFCRRFQRQEWTNR